MFARLEACSGHCSVQSEQYTQGRKGVSHWEEGGLVVAGSRVIQHPEEAMSSLAEVTLGLPLKALTRQEDKTGFRELERGKCVHHCPGGEGTNNPLNLRGWPSALLPALAQLHLFPRQGERTDG